jgi:histone deacetylase complex regulatory component SIN3
MEKKKKVEEEEPKTFLIKVKKALSKENYEIFKEILKKLKKELTLEEIKEISKEIKKIFSNNPTLIETFINFIPNNYEKEFQTYLNDKEMNDKEIIGKKKKK